jgi:hypothetical protein
MLRFNADFLWKGINVQDILKLKVPFYLKGNFSFHDKFSHAVRSYPYRHWREHDDQASNAENQGQRPAYICVKAQTES